MFEMELFLYAELNYFKWNVFDIETLLTLNWIV